MNNSRGTSTKQRIIETAAELFHKNGVKATSVDDVLEFSNTGKGQFYHYFSGKEELVREILQYYMKQFAEFLPNRLENMDEFEHWLRGFIARHAELGCQRACPIGSIGLELASNELIRKEVQLILLEMKKALVIFFTRMIERGVLSADAEQLADFVTSVIQGGAILGKIERSAEPFERAVESAINYLRLLQAELS